MAVLPGSAAQRLMREFQSLVKNPPDGIHAAPVSDDNLLEWEALLIGPEDTAYEFGAFTARLVFPVDYPLQPPSMRFTTPVYHPNVSEDGKVCISILHPPGEDRWGYELASERWSAAQSVEKILLSVLSMLAEPNADSPARVDAGKLWREDREEFNRRVRKDVRRSLGLTPPSAPFRS